MGRNFVSWIPPSLHLSFFLFLLPLTLYLYSREFSYTFSPCLSSKPSRCSRLEGEGEVQVGEAVGRVEGTSLSPISPRSSTSTTCRRHLTTSTQRGSTCISVMTPDVSFLWVFVFFFSFLLSLLLFSLLFISFNHHALFSSKQIYLFSFWYKYIAFFLIFSSFCHYHIHHGQEMAR